MSPGRDGTAVRCLIDADTLARRVRELGRQISADYAGTRPLLVGVLKGAWVFLADLVRALDTPVTVDFVQLSTYGGGTATTGTVCLKHDLSEPVVGRHVLVVEDIVDTGTCMHWFLDHLRGRGPASVKLCSLLDKPARRRAAVAVDYLGFTVPDVFVVGYGIDHDERWRELPYVGTPDPEGGAP